MWKILTIFAALFAAGGAYLAFDNKAAMDDEKELLADSKANLAASEKFEGEVAKTLKTTEEELDTETAAYTKVSGELETVVEDLEAKTKQLASEQTVLQSTQDQLKLIEDQVKEFGDIKQALATVEQVTTDVDSMQTELTTLKQDQSTVANSVAYSKERVQKSQLKERWQNEGKMDAINARVSMFSPEFGFVIISAGNNQGVVGDVLLDVVRGQELIATLKVVVLESSTSVCDVVSLTPGQRIQPGDRLYVNEASKPGSEPILPVATATTSAPDTGDAAGGAPAMDEEGLDPAGMGGDDMGFGELEPPAPDGGDAPDAMEDDNPFGL